jgi:hypothetical protein
MWPSSHGNFLRCDPAGWRDRLNAAWNRQGFRMRSKPWTLALALLLACAGLPVRAAKTCIDADIGIDSRHHAASDPSAGRGDTVANIHTGYGEDMLDRLVAEINGLLNEPAPRSRAVAVRWGGPQSRPPCASRKPRTSQYCRCAGRRVACGDTVRRSA